MQLLLQTSFNQSSTEICLIIAISTNCQFSVLGANLNQQSQGMLENIIRSGDLRMELGETLYIPILPHANSKVLVVCSGNENNLTLMQFRKLLQKTATVMQKIGPKQFYCELTELSVDNVTVAEKIFQTASLLACANYRFNDFKSVTKTPTVETLIIQASKEDINQNALKHAQALVAGINTIKDLGNLPPNICTPTFLAEKAQQFAAQDKRITTTILDEAEMEQLGMGALLAVSRGSAQPAKLICMHYQGGTSTQAPLVFIGKGITFDTGGISLKPAPLMDEMKYDMCGGATVFGLIRAVSLLQLPLNIIGLVPAAENMPGSKATRPGDIVKTMSGQTVEILNTDAEGRLILCDTLTYAEKFKPELVIDMATLTGAAIMTFDSLATCIMGNDEKLIHELLHAANSSGDRAWELPLWDEYQEMLTSNFADIPNIAAHNNAKTIIAGCFLKRFAKNFRWAHLDIAGSAFIGGHEKGATGRPLTMLLTYLLSN